jgi:hypothetical protein
LLLITESHIWLVLIFLPPFYFAGTPVRDLAYTLPWILSTVSWSSQTAFNLSSICLPKQHHLFSPPPSPALLKDNRALPLPIHRITARATHLQFPSLTHSSARRLPPLQSKPLKTITTITITQAAIDSPNPSLKSSNTHTVPKPWLSKTLPQSIKHLHQNSSLCLYSNSPQFDLKHHQPVTTTTICPNQNKQSKQNLTHGPHLTDCTTRHQHLLCVLSLCSLFDLPK